jgi:putative membrane protein
MEIDNGGMELMWWSHSGGEWWWMLFGGLWMIIFWGVIIGLVLWGIRQFTRDRARDAGPRETPLEIAQRRLARGELTREEFEELKQSLQ